MESADDLRRSRTNWATEAADDLRRSRTCWTTLSTLCCAWSRACSTLERTTTVAVACSKLSTVLSRSSRGSSASLSACTCGSSYGSCHPHLSERVTLVLPPGPADKSREAVKACMLLCSL